MNGLLPVAEAQARLLALATPVETETALLIDAAGRWLAADVVARRTQPASDFSAMDGYAICFGELPGPWRVVGESAAGEPFGGALAPGEAARIFTGAALPEGADAVLVQEDAARDGDRLTLAGEGPARIGAHVRGQGEDFGEGDVLLMAGERLTPPALGLAATGGHGALTVRRRIRVALITTGDELEPPGENGGADRLPASNGPMLMAGLRRLPVVIEDHGIVRDDLVELKGALSRAAGADIIVTTGGASVGDRDLVRPALEAAGAAIDFWRIAMKPGKPLLAGRLGEALVLGLPGNPASAFVTSLLFLHPLIARLSGASDPLPRPIRAMLAGDLPSNGDRAEYLRGIWAEAGVAPFDGQSSAALVTLARAELLIVRPINAPPAKTGDLVDVLDLA